MRLQLDRARLLVGRLLRIEERLERRLRIDDDLLAAGQVHEQIGAEAAVVADKRRLFVEVAAAQHPRDLDDAPQLHLAPAAADRGVRSARESVSAVEPSALTFSVSRA